MNSEVLYTSPKSEKGKFDEHLADRFNSTLGGKPSPQLIKARVDKIQISMTLIEDSIERLQSIGNTEEADKIAARHREISQSFAKANSIEDLSKRRTALQPVKKLAREWADVAQFVANGKVAAAECQNCDQLLDEAIHGLPQNSNNSSDGKALQKKVNELKNGLDKALKMKTASPEDLKKKAKKLQSIRSEFRIELANVQGKAKELSDAAINLAQLKQQAKLDLAQAENAVTGMTQQNPRLVTRAQECRKVIQAGFDANEQTARSTAIDKLNAGIAEANRISGLAAQLQEGDSLHEKVLAIGQQALQLAENNPDGPEAAMITAMGNWGDHWSPEEKKKQGQEAFSNMLTSAYELAALSGADITELSPGEVVAIFNYTTQDFKEMNNFCREKSVGDPEMDMFLTKKVETAKQALAKLSANKKYQGMTMRGENFWDGNAHEKVYVVGETYPIPQFWSTGIKMCFSWAPLQLTIFGKSGMQVQMMSEKPDETEVLFPPGTTFRITAKRELGKKEDKKYAILLEEV